MNNYIFKILLIVLIFGVFNTANAGIIDDLRNKINDRTSKIDELEDEIKEYQKELIVVEKEKTTLQNAVKTLDISQKKINTNIDITENRIYSTSLQINKIAYEITDKEELIGLHNSTLAKSIRQINQVDDQSFVEIFLTYDNISEVWEQVDELEQFQITLRENLSVLRGLKDELEDSKEERESRKTQLVNYNNDLEEQERSVSINKREKNNLLTITKNKESNYQNLIAEKEAARKEFERDLLNFEAQLKIAIDPDSIPTARSGVIASPLNPMTVTQYFGDTEFAQNGAYDGRGHNGVDLRASVGTRVKSALNGTIMASGNTDLVNGCYSYGKWIVVKHNNGLSTLYAHLSSIEVNNNQSVTTGQTIGYSGNTGYSTGPHLHFTLFATQGVRIVKLDEIKARTNCPGVFIPVAPLEAYLNPLQYI